MATVTTTLEEWEGRVSELRSLRAQLKQKQRQQNYYNLLAGDLLAEQLDWSPGRTLSFAGLFEGPANTSNWSYNLTGAGDLSRPEGTWGPAS